MAHNRRQFLQRTAGMVGAGTVLPKLAMGQTAPPPLTPYKTLEIFLAGGLSHQDTMYWEVGPNGPGHQFGLHGGPVSQGGWAIVEPFWDVTTGGSSPPWRDATGADPVNATADGYVAGWPSGGLGGGSPAFFVGNDERGVPIYCGQGFSPLLGTTWWGKSRVVTVGHGSNVHRVGSHFALTGSSEGRALAAGLAARLHRPGKTNYVIQAGGSAMSYHTRFALKTGSKGATAAPVGLLMLGGSLANTQALLNTAPSTASGLLAVHTANYSRRLKFNPGYSSGNLPVGPPLDPVRSEAFTAYQNAHGSMGQLSVANTAITQAMAALPASSTSDANRFHRSAGPAAVFLAKELLSDPTTQHVTLVVTSPPVGLDTHTVRDHDNQHYTRSNFAVMAMLNAIVAAGIDPATTLFQIHSEFGRYRPYTDYHNVDANQRRGTEHNGRGYTTFLAGGPLSGRSVRGALVESSVAIPGKTPATAQGSIPDTQGFSQVASCGWASPTGNLQSPFPVGFHPADVQAAMAVVSGLLPISEAGLSWSDLTWDGPQDEGQLVNALLNRML